MTAKVIGIKEVDYTSKKNGKPVVGRELHIAFEDEHVLGVAVDKIFTKLDVNLTIGAIYNFCYDYNPVYKSSNLVNILPV